MWDGTAAMQHVGFFRLSAASKRKPLKTQVLQGFFDMFGLQMWRIPSACYCQVMLQAAGSTKPKRYQQRQNKLGIT